MAETDRLMLINGTVDKALVDHPRILPISDSTSRDPMAFGLYDNIDHYYDNLHTLPQIAALTDYHHEPKIKK